MRRLLAFVLLLTALAGCSTADYAFRIDESIDVVLPEARASVTLPVTIRWTDSRKPENLRVAPTDSRAEYYAVFVDRAPMSPGKNLASLIDSNPKCEPSKGCPKEAQLTDINVYLAAKPSLSIEFIADLRPTSRGNQKDTHEVAIVRMRGDKRVGESAYLQTFFVRR